ncbi:neocarzinostatin apoprotein domain-containing protein [Nocardia sp. IFM 10818]
MIRFATGCLAAAAAAAVGAAAPLGSAAPEQGPTLVVSASSGLTEGQRITVDGSGFRPGLAAVAVGLCVRGFTSGVRDCDLGGGATFVNIAADGTFPTVTLTARPRFHDIDCTRQQCVIAAAPLPGAEPQAVIDANSAEVPVDFAGAPPLAATTPVPVAARAETELEGPSLPLWSVTAALLSFTAIAALADRRRL